LTYDRHLAFKLLPIRFLVAAMLRVLALARLSVAAHSTADGGATGEVVLQSTSKERRTVWQG
jgi:hypothetical protein